MRTGMRSAFKAVGASRRFSGPDGPAVPSSRLLGGFLCKTGDAAVVRPRSVQATGEARPGASTRLRERWIPVPTAAPIGFYRTILRSGSDRAEAQVPRDFARGPRYCPNGTRAGIALRRAVSLRSLGLGRS